MKKKKVTLVPLTVDDRERFILDNQWAFKYGAMLEFGQRDDHFEEEGEIISRKTIEDSIEAENAETYRIVYEGRKVGGVVLVINRETKCNSLDLFSSTPRSMGRGWAMPHGRLWRNAIPIRWSGKLSLLILKSAISISM